MGKRSKLFQGSFDKNIRIRLENRRKTPRRRNVKIIKRIQFYFPHFFLNFRSGSKNIKFTKRKKKLERISRWLPLTFTRIGPSVNINSFFLLLRAARFASTLEAHHTHRKTHSEPSCRLCICVARFFSFFSSSCLKLEIQINAKYCE